MIRWDLTQHEFGYGESEVRSYSKIVVQCDVCATLNRVGYGGHKTLVAKRGVYRCQKCVKSSKEYRSQVSKTMRERWEDERFRASAITTRNSVEYLNNAKAKAILLWDDIDYRDKIAEYNALPSTKSKRSQLSKQRWQSECRNKMLPNSDRCSKISNSVQAKWAELAFRERMVSIFRSPVLSAIKSENAKKQWQNEAYRVLMSMHYGSDEYKQRKSRISLDLWATPGFREKVLLAMSDPSVIARMSESSKKAWKSDDYRQKMISAAIVKRTQPSSIQIQLYKYLDDIGVQYHKEGPDTQIGFYLFDCLIVGRNLLIECQGDYWHSLDRAVNNDRSKFTYIDRYFPEYEIMYIWEHEFAAEGRVIDRLKTKLGIDPKTIDFAFGNVVLRECPRDDYKTFLDAYHYIGKGRGGVCFGAYLDDVLIACCVFSPPVRQNLTTRFGEFVELSRFCIHPLYHKKNFATWLLSRFIKIVSARKIVAYADTTVGHSGIIYKAANFQFSHEVAPDYWYVDNDGYVTRKKRLYEMARKLGMTEAAYASTYNYTKKWGGKKLCFVYER